MNDVKNTTKLPLRYTRRESTLDFEDFRCDRCLFEMDRPMFAVQDIIQMWNITCEHDKCTEPANFYIVGGSLYVVFVTCEHIVISIVVYVISHVNVETMIALEH